jgi:hypothetical protein
MVFIGLNYFEKVQRIDGVVAGSAEAQLILFS